MLGEIVFQLNVKLDEAVHGYRNTAAFNHHYLQLSVILMMPMLSPRESETYPDMRKCRVERCEAIAPGCFCDDCYNGHEDPHEAVLEHAKVNDLYSCQSRPNRARTLRILH